MTKKKWLDIIKIVVPMIVSVSIPGGGPVIAALIVQGITTAESSGQPGVTKLKIAKETISIIAQGINAAKPLTIDVTQLDDVIDDIISTSVGTANLIQNIPIKPAIVIA